MSLNSSPTVARQLDVAAQVLTVLDTAASAPGPEYTEGIVSGLRLAGRGDLVAAFLGALLSRAAERVESSLDAVIANERALAVAR